jgi:hypothetical protein
MRRGNHSYSTIRGPVFLHFGLWHCLFHLPAGDWVISPVSALPGVVARLSPSLTAFDLVICVFVFVSVGFLVFILQLF